MIKYIRADLYRIFRRRARIILVILFIYLVGSTFWPDNVADDTIVDVVDIIESMLKYAPPIIGIIEIFYVFGDDFAGKTAQIAIGTGITRKEVILTKWIDIIILAALDTIMITVIATGLSVIGYGSLPSQLLLSIISHVMVAIISVAAYISLVMPLMFAMQNVNLGGIIYLVLSFGLIFKLLGYVNQFEKLQKFNIGKITLTNGLNVLRSRMLLGSFHILSFIQIIIYTVIGIALTYLVYRNKELEF